jgi:hypothetical protein
MSNVTVTSSGGTNIFGVENTNSSPTMSNVTVTASGGSLSWGVWNQSNSSPTMRNVTITASGIYASGISNLDSSPIMHNVTVYLPGDSGFAMSNYTNSEVTLLVDRPTSEPSVEVHSLDKLGALMGPVN